MLNFVALCAQIIALNDNPVVAFAAKRYAEKVSGPGEQTTPPAIASYGIVVLTLLAPLLAGTRDLWAEAILISATGILFLIAPPRRPLPTLMTLLFLLLAASALVVFLRNNWFPPPEWRVAIQRHGVPLPSTRTAQPWLTLEATCLFWLGLAWAAYLAIIQSLTRIRDRILDLFCIGILLLAGTLAISFAFRTHVPFWPDVPEYGFFLNRNQTSNVLGLGGIAIYANAFHHLTRRRNSGWIWLGSLGLICWALIINTSRGGIVLFFAGIFAWTLWWWATRPKAEERRGVVFAPLILLVLLLAFAGGETLRRFTHAIELTAPVEGGGRTVIQLDALHVLRQDPIVGVGLGNFRGVFSAFRNLSFNTSQVIHPESDWLWMAVEMGIIPLVLLGTLIGVWIRRCFPFDRGSWRQVRVAGLLAGCGFIIHGFVDVSGHRLGSVWPALFLATLALHPAIGQQLDAVIRGFPSGSAFGLHLQPITSQLNDGGARLRRAAVPFVFRLLGVLFLVIGIWWFASLGGANVPPTSVTLQRLIHDADQAADRADYEQMLVRTNEALKIAALDWELYFKRGVAEAALFHPRGEVERDFAVARHLLPTWPELYLKEGEVWIGVNEPDLAFGLWRDGIHQLGEHGPELYERILGAVKSDAALLDRCRALAEEDRRLIILYLTNADRAGFDLEMDQILNNDPELRSFSAKDQRAIFTAWYQESDRLHLAELLRANPEWAARDWRMLARIYAEYGDYRQAYDTAHEHITPPKIPNRSSTEPLDRLESLFRLNPTPDNGLALYSAEMQEGRIDDALLTLNVLQGLRDHPRYVSWLEAELLAHEGKWDKAWNRLSEFLEP